MAYYNQSGINGLPPRLVRFLPFPPTCISAHPPLTQPVGNSRLPTHPSGPNASEPHSIPVLPSATSTYLARFLSTVGGGTSSLLLVPTTHFIITHETRTYFYRGFPFSNSEYLHGPWVSL